MESTVSTARQKAASAALFVFAFVGFIASVIAVMSYFQSTDRGALRVQITPNDFRIPLELAGPFEKGSASKRILDDLMDGLCTPSDGTKTTPTKVVPPQTSKAPPEEPDLSICERAQNAEWLARWASVYAESPGTLYEYEIENRGSAVAAQIRVAAEGIASLQIERGRKFADVQPDKSEGYYSLPDLNPREKATILIWMVGHDTELFDYADAPKVTFSGASVRTEMLRRVPEGWFDIYDLIGEAPRVVLVVLVVGISLLISLTFVLIIGITEALVKGKPIRSVFTTSAKANDDAPEVK